MNSNNKSINNLHRLASFALFITSYSPLFILIIVKQVSSNYNYLGWGGLSSNNIHNFLTKFGLSSILILLIIFGSIGAFITLSNINEASKNGYPVTLIDVKNKNSEAIGYIATYILPFLFQSLDGWYELFSITFILIIIYRIYINSSLILINPVLSFWYSIFEIDYLDNDKTRNGLIITKDKKLLDDSKIKIYEIGHKLFFSTNI